ncbi:ABC transporter ATP-binding protein [Saccharomonospora sp. NPDC046836]|uniref:ABC transporter ATP-binding protein n=1 Tax=Saccharomonospora sp. NPDC046836 TaxID=3156921 RepID=UPI0033DED8F7
MRVRSGDVRVLGTDPAKARPGWRARIGIVSQENASFPGLTVRDTVRHFARYYPRPRDPDEVLSLVGLDGKSAAQAAQLSGGQLRRLDVALGIIGNPEVLFLDEPTTGFAPEARRALWELIAQLSADGTTILLTTHYLDEAEALADRIGLLFDGRLVDIGLPETVGGRQNDLAQVHWDPPEGHQVVETATPTRTVTELAERYGGEVPGLRISRATLEDVYLRLIGEHQ